LMYDFGYGRSICWCMTSVMAEVYWTPLAWDRFDTNQWLSVCSLKGCVNQGTSTNCGEIWNLVYRFVLSCAYIEAHFKQENTNVIEVNMFDFFLLFKILLEACYETLLVNPGLCLKHVSDNNNRIYSLGLVLHAFALQNLKNPSPI